MFPPLPPMNVVVRQFGAAGGGIETVIVPEPTALLKPPTRMV